MPRPTRRFLVTAPGLSERLLRVRNVMGSPSCVRSPSLRVAGTEDIIRPGPSAGNIAAAAGPPRDAPDRDLASAEIDGRAAARNRREPRGHAALGRPSVVPSLLTAADAPPDATAATRGEGSMRLVTSGPMMDGHGPDIVC
mmetsp:Transcript_34894/g.78300  ORF Transcript_34894/g.78300 Transcript_34894/m.78300 type:complete len:141 (+) Transcript_34894:523-945(+)